MSNKLKRNERLKAFRENFGFSQRVMASYLGVTKEHYQKLEYGTRKPSHKAIVTCLRNMNEHDPREVLSAFFDIGDSIQ